MLKKPRLDDEDAAMVADRGEDALVGDDPGRQGLDLGHEEEAGTWGFPFPQTTGVGGG